MAATDPVTPRKLLRLRTTSRRVAAGSRDYKKQMRSNLGIVPPGRAKIAAIPASQRRRNSFP